MNFQSNISLDLQLWQRLTPMHGRERWKHNVNLDRAPISRASEAHYSLRERASRIINELKAKLIAPFDISIPSSVVVVGIGY
jgi:hypothetical protein